MSYLRHWVDEDAEKIFCLVEAETAEDANAIHREANGLVAGEIYAVSEHT
ncbi:MAG TPA: nickel-binding protein [Ilumatobacter sp.]|nr:nickel-binding protein [Ilumatobacter sp.]